MTAPGSQLQHATKGQADMPTVKGKAARTKKGIAKNISTEIRAGKPPKQAVAIAMNLAGKSKRKKKKKK